MTLTELLPQLKELTYDEKSQAIEFLRQEMTTEEERKVMKEAETKVLELLEKYPQPERDYAGIAGVEAGIKMMEYLEKHEKAKV